MESLERNPSGDPGDDWQAEAFLAMAEGRTEKPEPREQELSQAEALARLLEVEDEIANKKEELQQTIRDEAIERGWTKHQVVLPKDYNDWPAVVAVQNQLQELEKEAGNLRLITKSRIH